MITLKEVVFVDLKCPLDFSGYPFMKSSCSHKIELLEGGLSTIGLVPQLVVSPTSKFDVSLSHNEGANSYPN